MSDPKELVERLRAAGSQEHTIHGGRAGLLHMDAASLIESQAAEIEMLQDSRDALLDRATTAEATKLREALKQIAEHPEKHDSKTRSYGVGWAFQSVQSIARTAIRARALTNEETK